MKYSKEIHRASERLLAIKWELDITKANSQLSLMREYFRRSALWKLKLNTQAVWPFFDIGLVLNPYVQIPSNVLERVKKQLNDSCPSMFESVTCLWYLNWVAATGVYEDQTVENLPAPYEPLMLFYERGGGFRREHVFVEVGSLKLGISDWKKYTQVQSRIKLDGAFLDGLDNMPFESAFGVYF